MRCFLAVPIAEPALAETQRLEASLRERIPATRWARPETLHLTVHFFGYVDDDRALSAVELVRPLATRTAAFDVEMSTLGAFPPRGAPRVLWAGPARDVAPLTAVHVRLTDPLPALAFRPDGAPGVAGAAVTVIVAALLFQ